MPVESAAVAEQLELVVIVGDALRVFPLPPRGVLSLGRNKKCDVRIDSASVSRLHARLHLFPRLAIEDLGSQNGTFVAEKVPAGDETQPLRRLQSEPFVLSIGERVNLGVATIAVRRAPCSARGEQAVILDPAMRSLHTRLRLAARGQVSILLLGETGVGKEVFAREVHAASPRANGPFVALDCSSVPPALVEDHLFGHSKSAFTNADRERPGYFEAANKGTLFLDEIGELPLEVQAKFLRALEERAVTRLGETAPRRIDVRIVAATNRDLHEEAARGNFRLDLLHRIGVLDLEIPPLRQRPSEIEPLASRFILHFARMLEREPPSLAPETLSLLLAFAWPGNVRELRNVIERAVTLCQGHLIVPEDLPPRLSLPQSAPVPAAIAVQHASLLPGATERDRIKAALEACAGNQTRAAELLQISRRTLVNRMKALNLPRPRKPKAN
jgi:two-component system response regulator AtoC